MIDAQKIFAENLRRKREKLTLSQEALAEMVGLQRNTISYMETSRKNNLSFESINKICNNLNISPAELFVINNPEAKDDKLLKIMSIISSFDDEKFDWIYKMINALE